MEYIESQIYCIAFSCFSRTKAVNSLFLLLMVKFLELLQVMYLLLLSFNNKLKIVVGAILLLKKKEERESFFLVHTVTHCTTLV